MGMQYTLECREMCINFANEILDAINGIFAGMGDTNVSTDTTQNTTSSQNQSQNDEGEQSTFNLNRNNNTPTKLNTQNQKGTINNELF